MTQQPTHQDKSSNIVGQDPHLGVVEAENLAGLPTRPSYTLSEFHKAQKDLFGVAESLLTEREIEGLPAVITAGLLIYGFRTPGAIAVGGEKLSFDEVLHNCKHWAKNIGEVRNECHDILNQLYEAGVLLFKRSGERYSLNPSIEEGSDALLSLILEEVHNLNLLYPIEFLEPQSAVEKTSSILNTGDQPTSESVDVGSVESNYEPTRSSSLKNRLFKRFEVACTEALDKIAFFKEHHSSLSRKVLKGANFSSYIQSQVTKLHDALVDVQSRMTIIKNNGLELEEKQKNLLESITPHLVICQKFLKPNKPENIKVVVTHFEEYVQQHPSEADRRKKLLTRIGLGVAAIGVSVSGLLLGVNGVKREVERRSGRAARYALLGTRAEPFFEAKSLAIDSRILPYEQLVAGQDAELATRSRSWSTTKISTTAREIKANLAKHKEDFELLKKEAETMLKSGEPSSFVDRELVLTAQDREALANTLLSEGDKDQEQEVNAAQANALMVMADFYRLTSRIFGDLSRIEDEKIVADQAWAPYTGERARLGARVLDYNKGDVNELYERLGTPTELALRVFKDVTGKEIKEDLIRKVRGAIPSAPRVKTRGGYWEQFTKISVELGSVICLQADEAYFERVFLLGEVDKEKQALEGAAKRIFSMLMASALEDEQFRAEALSVVLFSHMRKMEEFLGAPSCNSINPVGIANVIISSSKDLGASFNALCKSAGVSDEIKLKVQETYNDWSKYAIAVQARTSLSNLSRSLKKLNNQIDQISGQIIPIPGGLTLDPSEEGIDEAELEGR